MSQASGCLYVVATPIGNLEDMTPRAQRVLGEVDLILAEDTRHSRPLLTHFGIATPLKALHEHNERRVADALCQRMAEGESMALISDAGTPLISDPGYVLVKAAHAHAIRVLPVPGASAMMAALSAAGLPSDRFVFEGFLPAKSRARSDYLQSLSGESRTLIFFESTHRIREALADMVAVMGAERQACLARELTKRFETIKTATLGELQQFVEADANQQKGEFVIILAGVEKQARQGRTLQAEQVLEVLLEELPTKQAATLAARITGEKKNALYELALSKKH